MTIEWLEPDGPRIVARQQLPGAGAAAVWALWTEPEGITRWWAEQAEIDRTARTLHLSWPAMDWHLRGRLVEWEPERKLMFTWRWDHEPELPERTVTVELAPIPDGSGTHITLTQGDYGDTDVEAADRQSHVDGWDFFLPRLAAAAGAE